MAETIQTVGTDERGVTTLVTESNIRLALTPESGAMLLAHLLAAQERFRKMVDHVTVQ